MHGEQAEEAVAALSGQLLMGTPVSVSIYPNECLLCVAHLPLNLDEADFRAMVGEYGAIERAFLMFNKEGEHLSPTEATACTDSLHIVKHDTVVSKCPLCSH